MQNEYQVFKDISYIGISGILTGCCDGTRLWINTVETFCYFIFLTLEHLGSLNKKKTKKQVKASHLYVQRKKHVFAQLLVSVVASPYVSRVKSLLH